MNNQFFSFISSGDKNNNGNNMPNWTGLVLIFLLIAFTSTGYGVWVLPIAWVGFMFYILTVSKRKTRNTKNQADAPHPKGQASSYETNHNQPSKSERDYQMKKTKRAVEIPVNTGSYERSDLPSAKTDKMMQRERDSHTHTGGSAFDSYTGNYATGTVRKCKCPNCGHVTDTAHRFCGKCDTDLSK